MAHAAIIVPSDVFLSQGQSVTVHIEARGSWSKLGQVDQPVLLYRSRRDNGYCGIARLCVGPSSEWRPHRITLHLDDVAPFPKVIGPRHEVMKLLAELGYPHPVNWAAARPVQLISPVQHALIVDAGEIGASHSFGFLEPPQAEFSNPAITHYHRLALIRDPAFRGEVIRAYGYRCAFCAERYFDVVSGYTLLKAIHLQALASLGPNHVCNGMLACGTHHDGYDAGSIHIWDDFSWSWIKGSGQDYRTRHVLHLPDDPALQPDLALIHQHQAQFPPVEPLR